MAADNLTFELDAIALCQALLLDDTAAYVAILDADDSPQRLRELVAGTVGGWAACISAFGTDALPLLAAIRADVLADVARADR